MNLNHVMVPSQDVEASIKFYKKLGLILIVEDLPNYARFECPRGEATFSLHKFDKVPQGDGIYVYFESSELDSWVEELVEKGIQFDQMPKDEPYLWREAKLKDPNGNQLVLYTAGKYRKDPPWKINRYEE